MAIGANVKSRGDTLLRQPGEKIEYTAEMQAEMKKCKNNIVYFTSKYLKTFNADAQSLVPFIPRDYQKTMFDAFENHNRVICMTPRQAGKSVTVAAFIVWSILFKGTYKVAILANKKEIAMEILDVVKQAYENLPKWLQHGVTKWNEGTVKLESGAVVRAAATSASGVRGMTFNLVFIDEFAHIENHIADKFFNSVFPTISSGQKTKMFIVSTPKGLNRFYKMWTEAEQGKNSFKAVRVRWQDVPGRTEAWKQKYIADTDINQWEQEQECEFMGSSDTLLSGECLRNLAGVAPISSSEYLDIYSEPIKSHDYVITVDVARGTNKDHSAFIVFDITKFPHKVVAKYYNANIPAMLFPDPIYRAAKAYNSAWVLCEVNDVGNQVAETLFMTHEYENILMTKTMGRSGQVLGCNLGLTNTQYGVKMSTTVKKVGCANLKTVLESHKLLLQDYTAIRELSTFVLKSNGTYSADDGEDNHDDLCMCLVLYAWMLEQPFFKDLTNSDVRKKLYHDKISDLAEEVEQLCAFVVDNLPETVYYDKSTGMHWDVVPQENNPYFYWLGA